LDEGGSSAASLLEPRWKRLSPDALRFLLRLLLGVLLLLLGDLDLRVGIRLLDEQLSALPAEDRPTRTIAKRTFQAVVISCCAVE
jgi:hypothetical protein